LRNIQFKIRLLQNANIAKENPLGIRGKIIIYNIPKKRCRIHARFINKILRVFFIYCQQRLSEVYGQNRLPDIQVRLIADYFYSVSHYSNIPSRQAIKAPHQFYVNIIKTLVNVTFFADIDSLFRAHQKILQFHLNFSFQPPYSHPNQAVIKISKNQIHLYIVLKRRLC